MIVAQSRLKRGDERYIRKKTEKRDERLMAYIRNECGFVGDDVLWYHHILKNYF